MGDLQVTDTGGAPASQPVATAPVSVNVSTPPAAPAPEAPAFDAQAAYAEIMSRMDDMNNSERFEEATLRGILDELDDIDEDDLTSEGQTQIVAPGATGVQTGDGSTPPATPPAAGAPAATEDGSDRHAGAWF